MTVRWKRFEAVVDIPKPNDVPRLIEALAAVDCEFEYDPDVFDDYGPTVTGTITGTTEFDYGPGGIGDWLGGIIAPFKGFLVEWELIGADPPDLYDPPRALT
jgi:hypothetical protein